MKKRKLRILQFICPAGFYGAERWVLALGNNSNQDLVSHHLAVTIDPGADKIELIAQYAKLEGLKCFKIKTNGRFDWSAVSRLASLLQEEQIDIIHTHGYKSDIIGIIAAKWAGVKAISTPHGFGEISSLKMRLFVRVGCISYRFFDQVVPLSHELLKEVALRGAPRGKLMMIKNGVDLKEVDAISSSTSKAYPKEMGYIGRLSPGKQVDHIIRAFSSLYKDDQSLYLTLIGDGPCRKELEALAAELGCISNVNFLGFREDRLELLSCFDVFVLASKAEGIPRCLMEAMGMGVPIVAYDIQGVDVLIKNEENGCLAPLGDLKQLTDHVSRILYDSRYAKRLAANAKGVVQSEFSAARMSSEYLALYYQLLDMR